MSNPSLIAAQDVILEKINNLCGKFGLNNIMTQLYAVLYFSGKPLSLDDMVERLKISKGSASVNIRALERYRAVRKVWVKGSRRDYYEAESDITKVITDRIRSMVTGRLSEVNDMITSSYQALNSVTFHNEKEEESVKIFNERLKKLQAIYDQARTLFDLFEMGVINSLQNGKKDDQIALAANAKTVPGLQTEQPV